MGYTTGVFDLFHVGHLNILRNARSLCDKLIVGVSTDEVVQYKNKKPVIPFNDRIEIVRACKYVDVAVPQITLDKLDAWNHYKYHTLFVGDDWFRNKSWKELENNLNEQGVKIIYFPYTKGTSSTLVNDALSAVRKRVTHHRNN